MKRLSPAMIILAIAFSLASCKKEAIVLKYANYTVPEGFPCIQMERWKKEIEKRTNGRVAIATYPDSKLLSSMNMHEGVKTGLADIGCFCMAYQPEKYPFSNVIGLPLDVTSARAGSVVLFDLYKKYNPAEFQDVKMITMFVNAPANIMSMTPIRTLGDLAGKEVRGSGGAAEILKMWGANAVDFPIPSTIKALRRKAIIGVFSSLDTLKDFGFAEFCTYATITQSVVYPFAVIMNKKTWEGLPKEVQQAIEELSMEHSEWTGNYSDTHANESISWSEKFHQLKIIQLSAAERSLWSSKLYPLKTKWIAEAKKAGLPADDILKDAALLIEKQPNAGSVVGTGK